MKMQTTAPGTKAGVTKLEKFFIYFCMTRFQNQKIILSLCRSAKDHAVVVELVDTLA